MKALIYKDYLLCRKSMLLYVLMAVCLCIMNSFGLFFAVIYGINISTYVFTYDTQCKWDTLERMLPYSLRSRVYSLYIFSITTAIFVVTVSHIARCLFVVILKTQSEAEDIGALIYIGLGCALAVTIMLCIDIPLTYRFGVATARIAKLALYGGVASLVAIVMVSVGEDVLDNWASSASKLISDILNLPTAVIILVSAVICAGLVVLSAEISMRILKKKMS